MTTTPETPVRFLKGVGASRAKTLEEYGLTAAHDLLWFFPFRYEDRRHPTHIADLGHHLDEAVLVRGRIISAHSKLSPVKRMKIFEAVLEDETGAVKLVWFNQPFLADQIKRGDRFAIFGARPMIGLLSAVIGRQPYHSSSTGSPNGSSK